MSAGHGRRAGPPATRGAPVRRGHLSACDEFRSLVFEPLPAAGEEVREIADLWLRDGRTAHTAVLRLTGAEASEGAVKARARSARVLHLATHGFFVGAECSSGSALGRAARSPSLADAGRGPPGAESPLLLSGLALAGANRRDRNGTEGDDGVLTAEEIGVLDLSGVEWVVLSACDTGLGEVAAGEGVFGLRRAFQTAGAGAVIMSLWSVDDASARAWMFQLYRARLRDGRATAEAVWQASRAVLAQRRAAGRDVAPCYWAGFIATGDWR